MRNERGYTLVITLLMITLIFIVSAALIANSVNSAKQNKLTGSTYLATQIAEMGVRYVEEKLKAEFEEFDYDEENDDPVEIIDDLLNDFKIEVDETTNHIDNDWPERAFEINSMRIDPDEYKRVISFTSIGSVENGKQKDLTAMIEIKIPKDESVSDGGSIIDIEDIIDGITPEYHDSVPTSWFSLARGKTYVYRGDSTFPQFGINEDNTLIVEGNATFNGSIDTKKNLLIAVFGDANFKNNISESENTQILVAGNASVSTMILGKNSIFKAQSFAASNNVTFGEGSQFSICGDSKFKSSSAIRNNQINICGDADFDNGGINFNDYTTTNIKGKATFGQVYLNDNATLNIGEVLKTQRFETSSSNARIFGDTIITGTTQQDGGVAFKKNSHLLFAGDFIIENTSGKSEGGNFTVEDNSLVQIFGNSEFGQLDVNKESTVQLFGNLLVRQRINSISSNSIVEVLGNATLQTGAGGSGPLVVYGSLSLPPDHNQFNSAKICVKGKINASGWPAGKIQKSTATSCDSVGTGIYEMPNLHVPSIPPIPNKNNYFTDCAETCRLGDFPDPPSYDNIPINIVDVTYQ